VRRVAVLCVSPKSIYKRLPFVDAYDKARDARTYFGDDPIVAHPPCRAWSAFCSHQAKPTPGEKDLAVFCVEAIRKNGGVLEHPAHSRLWKALDLPTPSDGLVDGLWTIEVKQSWFGDARRKSTWLLLSGVDLVSVPVRPHSDANSRQKWNSMSKAARAATSLVFAEWLLDIARKSRI
jgi:hypothetical protein